MPVYQYTGDDARYYPGLGVHARPADDQGPATVAEFDLRPPAPTEGEQPEGARWVPDDGRWAPAKKKPTTPATASAPAAQGDPAAAGSTAGTGQKEA